GLSAALDPVRRDHANKKQHKRMAPCGAIAVSTSGILPAVAFLDHDATMVPMPARVPMAMPAIFRASAAPVVMIAAALDDDSLGAGNGRRRNRDRTQRRDDITKLPHVLLLTLSRD